MENTFIKRFDVAEKTVSDLKSSSKEINSLVSKGKTVCVIDKGEIKEILFNKGQTGSDFLNFLGSLETVSGGVKTWGNNSIAIYCGDTVEKWDYRSVNKGIGASELAVIKLSELWSEKGYDVTVFCNVPTGLESMTNCPPLSSLERSKVKYLPSSQFEFLDNFNILIVWRILECLSHLNIKAKKCFVDLHDIIDPRQILPRIISNTTKFCVKSRYHRSMISEVVPKEKIAVISNGGASKGLSSQKRDRDYIIYTSSYDRGLAFMLKWGWPKIKKEHPSAFLKLFYGWNGFDALRPTNEDTRLYKKLILDLMNQNGVEECGRVSHTELLKEREKANIHWYTGDFQEIDCVSVRESASLGCIPVVTDYMKVFEEKPYCIRISGNPKTKEVQEKAAAKIIELLKNRELCEETRKSILVSNSETWDSVSDQWIKLFKE